MTSLLNGGIDMKIVDLMPSFYCLYMRRHEEKEEIFLQEDFIYKSDRLRLDLFETEAAAYRWIEEEQKINTSNEHRGTYALYDKLYPKKIFVTEFSALMKEKEDIDSITVVSKHGVRRLYFRGDLEDDFHTFPTAHQKIYPKEPISIINRQKQLDQQVTLQKDTYFVSYPVIARPLFSVGIEEWADDLISRRPNDGFYIEETTLHDIYLRTELEEKDPGFFILSRENAPHYILRKADLKKIIDGEVEYR